MRSVVAVVASEADSTVWSMLTLTVPPEITVEIGEIPTTEVSPLVDAGVKITPPEPLAASRYPFGLVPELIEIVEVLLFTEMSIGVEPTRVSDPETAF